VNHVFCGDTCRRAFAVGVNSPAWRGGSDPNRGAQWLKIAVLARDRDGHCCRRCGKTEAENGRRLDVDHIRPWRSFTDEREANQLSNLASLCSACHRRKTNVVERAWLRGDVIGFQQFEQSLKLDSAVKGPAS